MIKIRKKYYIFAIVVFFSFFNIASASLEISEIMYAPFEGASYEWVEIYNNSSTPVDLDNYRFFHGETTSSPVNLKIGSSTVLEAGKYLIIAKSMTDYSWVGTGCTILSSTALSLPDDSNKYNTYIAISDADKNIIDYITYDTNSGGSKESKSSLSKIDNNWVDSTPTPGMQNYTSDEEDLNNDTTETSSLSSENSLVSTKKEEKVYKINTKIISPKVVTAGVPFNIEHITNGLRNENIILGKFVWNFGDGMAKTEKTSLPFYYTYEYPGEYSLSLAFYDSAFDIKPDAKDALIIKVVSSGINISSVGNSLDPFIEIENTSKYEISLYGFFIKGDINFFAFPEGLTILPNKKIKLSPKITGFNIGDLSNLKIFDKLGVVFANYPNVISQPTKYKTVSSFQNNIIKSDSKIDTNSNEVTEIINLNDLPANAINSNEKNINRNTYTLLIFIGIILIGITSILFIRKKHINKDYIEKEINANDMTIIE